jgi:hypothetical protein
MATPTSGDHHPMSRRHANDAVSNVGPSSQSIEVPPFVVHTSIATTAAVYAHVLPSLQKDAAAKLETAITE